VTEIHEHAWEGSPAQCVICGAWHALNEANRPSKQQVYDYLAIRRSVTRSGVQPLTVIR